MRLDRALLGMAVLAAASALTLGGLRAEEEGHWKFKIINKSQTAAVEFRTMEDEEWSDNWISQRIQPGDSFDMDFNHDTGDCTVRTQIHFTDGTSFDAPVDYCKVNTLYIYETKLRWD